MSAEQKMKEMLVCSYCNVEECEDKSITEYVAWGLCCDDCYIKKEEEDSDSESEIDDEEDDCHNCGCTGKFGSTHFYVTVGGVENLYCTDCDSEMVHCENCDEVDCDC